MRRIVAGLVLAGAAEAQSTAVLTGRVVDSLQHPLANSIVRITAPDTSATTDASGAFRIGGIPVGSHRVQVLHIGYTRVDTTITFAANQQVMLTVTMKPVGYGIVVELDTVSTAAASGRDPDMAEFEEHRARGFGKFMTRVDLAKLEGRPMGNVLLQLQGLGVVRGYSNQAWLMAKRAPISRCVGVNGGQQKIDECLRIERVYYVPEPNELMQGMTRQCYALVYLDKSPMNYGHPVTPFDINSINPSSLEALEWYESPSQIPPQYAGRASDCGLLILHTIRFHK